MNSHFILLAGDPARSFWAVSSGQELLLLILTVVMLLGLVGIGLLALNLLFTLRNALNPRPIVVSAAQPADLRSRWQRIVGLHLLSEEKTLLLEHDYDEITELDNPTPPWFMGLFFGSITIAIVYMIVFHVVGSGDIMRSEYVSEMAIANKQREAYIVKVAGGINENTVKFVSDAKSLGDGKAIYLQNCVACHGQAGQGGVGPNLTDAYWLHGGTVKAVFHTLTEGVAEKGMMSWKKQLNPLQIQQLASYVLSLQGSNPAGAKAPQGEKETAAGAPAGVSLPGAPMATR
jgi:cytochrome c oxidase cbb3-type subunit III